MDCGIIMVRTKDGDYGAFRGRHTLRGDRRGGGRMAATDALLGTTTLSAAHALNGCYSGGIHLVLECCSNIIVIDSLIA